MKKLKLIFTMKLNRLLDEVVIFPREEEIDVRTVNCPINGYSYAGVRYESAWFR